MSAITFHFVEETIKANKAPEVTIPYKIIYLKRHFSVEKV